MNLTLVRTFGVHWNPETRKQVFFESLIAFGGHSIEIGYFFGSQENHRHPPKSYECHIRLDNYLDALMRRAHEWQNSRNRSVFVMCSTLSCTAVLHPAIKSYDEKRLVQLAVFGHGLKIMMDHLVMFLIIFHHQ